MDAHIEHRWDRRTFEITLYERRNGELWVQRIDGQGASRWEQSANNADAPYTFSLREDEFEAIMREAMQIVPVTEATTTHLKDAIEVRDRLLTLVEKQS